VEEAEGGVGVEEDNELVLLDVVRQRRGLDPCRMAVLEVLGVDEFVVVAMYLGICIVVKDAARDVVDVAPVVVAVVEVLRRLKVACLQVQN
jgi:hypothetical protein